MSTPNKTAPDFGEPWQLTTDFAFDITIQGELAASFDKIEHSNRAIACVNACRGMADPAKEIERLCQERDEARAIVSACMSAMPIGNIQTHTPENLAARIGDLASALAAETSENEAMREAIKNIYYLTEGYADGAPDASAHDKLCNEIADKLKPLIKP